MAINRHEINQVLFYGLTLEGNNTVQPDSPLYEERFRTNWAKFDLKHANRLLDELGLTERRRDGVRLLPDGRAMEIIVQLGHPARSALGIRHDEDQRNRLRKAGPQQPRCVMGRAVQLASQVHAHWSASRRSAMEWVWIMFIRLPDLG